MYKMKKGFGYPCLIGFILGVMMTNIWTDSTVLQTGFLSGYALERLKYIQVDGNQLFLYVLQSRFQLILLILIAGTTILGFLCSYLFAGWFGLAAGIMVSVLTLQFGIKGSFLFLACLLPQMLFYAPGFYKLLRECCDISCKLYFPNRVMLGAHSRNGKLGHFGRILTGIGVVIIGIFLESYVNPIIVAKAVIILKIL